jgi:hypothetical protein
MTGAPSDPPEFQVLKWDNHLLVVNKPPSILTQADRSGDRDLLTAAKDFIKRVRRKPGRVYMGLVSRPVNTITPLPVFPHEGTDPPRLIINTRCIASTATSRAWWRWRALPRRRPGSPSSSESAPSSRSTWPWSEAPLGELPITRLHPKERSLRAGSQIPYQALRPS